LFALCAAFAATTNRPYIDYSDLPAMGKCKQTITLESLKTIGKEFLKEPMTTHYLCDDLAVVVACHFDFFVAVAPITKRLNPCSLQLMIKELWQLNAREAKQFGDSLAAAYSYCMTAGSKSTTGVKLTKEVLGVYRATGGTEFMCVKPKQEVKQEGGAAVKRAIQGEPLSPPPAKSLKKCLSSPSQIRALYAGSSSSSKVKVDGFVWTLQTQTQRRHITKCLLDICAATQSGGFTKTSSRDLHKKTNQGGEEGRRG
jgi:hypothetical protein